MINRANRSFQDILRHIEGKRTPYSNLTKKIIGNLERQLWKEADHPIRTLALRLQEFYSNEEIHKSDLQDSLPIKYSFHDEFSPIVSTTDCFDKILIPKDHVSRKRSDTFYVNEEEVLRTHTSAHQNACLANKETAFCVLGDVYRKDEIDKSHYPVFHQMEALRYYSTDSLKQLLKTKFSGLQINTSEIVQNKTYKYFGSSSSEEEVALVQLIINDLKQTHASLMRFLLEDSALQTRWNNDYFPFTEPSFELEMHYEGGWLEVMGSGVVHRDVLLNGGVDPMKNIGWASGIGLERIAMLMFKIPDIRLFWSKDQRFISQFKEGENSIFEVFSKYPPCHKDISFYISDNSSFEENELFDSMREIAGDLIEDVELIDEFHNKRLNKLSRCYRINYRSLERTLTNEEIDILQFRIRAEISNKFGLELR